MMLQTATPDEPIQIEQEDLNKRSDQQLIAAANAGEMAAFSELYEKHKDWVVNLAFRFTGQRELALDVLQETFLYFWKKFPGFVLTAQLRTFLYPVVRNFSISLARKTSRFKTDDDVLQTAPAPEKTAAEGDDFSIIFAQLPEQQREVLMLRFVEEFSLEEVATALEIPLGTVKSRLHNALTTLRKNPLTRKFFKG